MFTTWFSSTLCVCVFQHVVAVWLLSSLIMVNLWTGDAVKDLSLCQSASSCSGGGNHSDFSCPDRLCLVTENTSGQVASYVTFADRGTHYSLIPRLSVEAWVWDLGMRPEHETWVWDLGMRPGYETWLWDLGMRPGYETWVWDWDLRPGYETWVWDLGMRPWYETWVWDPGMRPGYEAKSWIEAWLGAS